MHSYSLHLSPLTPVFDCFAPYFRQSAAAELADTVLRGEARYANIDDRFSAQNWFEFLKVCLSEFPPTRIFLASFRRFRGFPEPDLLAAPQFNSGICNV